MTSRGIKSRRKSEEEDEPCFLETRCFSPSLSWEPNPSERALRRCDGQQIGLIKDTAVSICNTVKDIKGEKTDVQIQGEIKGQLSGRPGVSPALKPLQRDHCPEPSLRVSLRTRPALP